MIDRVCDYFTRLWQSILPIKAAAVPRTTDERDAKKNCYRSINEDAEF